MTQTTQRSTRLRSDVRLYAARDGYLLRVGEAHHHVKLAPAEADALLDALVTGGDPGPETARAALGSLVDLGLVDVPAPHLTVVGDGTLADALRSALVRMGVRVSAGGSIIAAHDDDQDLPRVGDACWIDGDLVLLAPPHVPARDVAARRAAATSHRDTDPLTRPLPGGRSVVPAPRVPRAGLELAAVTFAGELLRRDRSTHEAVVVDLHELTFTRRPVLPVPPAPR